MQGLEYSNISYYDERGKFVHRISYVNYEHFNKVKKEKIKRGLIK